MADFNGTQIADTISGTNSDDTILGLGGDDTINGAGGNDAINGGAGIDDILGGAGDDTITIINGEGANDVIDGGDGTDIVIAELRALNTINNGPGILGTDAAILASSIEFVQVSNASDFLVDLASDAVFGLDTTATSTDTFVNATTATVPAASGATALELLLHTAGVTSTFAADANADNTAGLIIDGTTYMAGDTYMSADGGSVAITFAGGVWSVNYTPPEAALFAVGVSGDASDDIITTVVATVTNTDGSTVDVTVNFALDLDRSFVASGSSVGITTSIDSQNNIIVGSAFDDVFFAGGGVGSSTDNISGGAGDDVIFAGAGDAGVDNIDGGEGDDIIGGGGGNDVLGFFSIGNASKSDAGNDTYFGGDGNDIIGDFIGDNVFFGGDGGDTISGFGGTGANTFYGGDGSDGLTGGDGNDTFYGGTDDSTDNVTAREGDDLIFGGDGADSLRGSEGNDTIFNGAGDDTTVEGGDGEDLLYGGAGNDTLTGGNEDDTFFFVAGNGNDTIADFDLVATGTGTIGDVIDLTAFGFADTQAVLDVTTGAANAVIAIAPGQTVTLTGVSKANLQATADDWVLV